MRYWIILFYVSFFFFTVLAFTEYFDFTLWGEKGVILEKDTYNPFKLIIYIIISFGSFISIFIHWCFSLLFFKLEKFKNNNLK